MINMFKSLDFRCLYIHVYKHVHNKKTQDKNLVYTDIN